MGDGGQGERVESGNGLAFHSEMYIFLQDK